MRNFKKWIPMGLFALAIAGAFSTHAMSRSSKAVAVFPGYTKGNLAGTICNTSIDCTSEPGELCMVGSTQVWGKDASNRCVVELHRIE